MRKNEKGSKLMKIYTALIGVIILILAFGIVHLIPYNKEKTDESVPISKNEITQTKVETTAEKLAIPEKKIEKKTTEPEKPPVTKIIEGKTYTSNQEIKEDYGKIETVYLTTGEIFTGAVIFNNSQSYKIVTVNGIMDIPMTEIKMRSIIK